MGGWLVLCGRSCGWMCQAIDIILVNCFLKAADVQSMSGVEMMLNRAGGNCAGAGSACGLEQKNNMTSIK